MVSSRSSPTFSFMTSLVLFSGPGTSSSSRHRTPSVRIRRPGDLLSCAAVPPPERESVAYGGCRFRAIHPKRRWAVTLVPATVERSPVAELPPPRRGTSASWLVVSCYLMGALAVAARLGASPARRMPVGDGQDVNMFAWFLRYSATAIGHGRLPALVTTALNAPRGVSLMWNTSFLLPGTLLSPVTLLAGPQVSLTIALTLGFAGSAASLFWVLRRWGASISAAALSGAVYGFSPAMLNAGFPHSHRQCAVLPPLITDAVLRLVTARGRSIRVGGWLGLLCAAQLFT